MSSALRVRGVVLPEGEHRDLYVDAGTVTYDPVPALEKLRVPVLAVWGAKDTYLPVPETVTVFERAMAKAGNRDSLVKVYPDGNHSLIVSETGSPSTGGKERSFVAGLWQMNADWLLKHVGLPK